MANITTRESYDRRQNIWKDWCRGIRSISELSKRNNCDYYTVKRDLILLRQGLRRKHKEETLEFIRQEEDRGLLQDIAQIEELIEEIRKYKPETQKGIVEGGKIIEGSIEKSPIGYNAIGQLIDRKIKLRRQREELWGLITPQKGNVNIAVSAHASASSTPKNITFKDYKENEDKNETTGISHAEKSPGSNRLEGKI